MHRLLAPLVLLTPLAAFASVAGKGWELVGTKDDIVTYRREVPGSPVIAIRGVAVVDAPILNVASVLMDTSRLTQWMDRVAEARRIRAPSAQHFVEYERASTPFPLTDRDFVIGSWVEIDAAKKQIVLKARSVEDPSVPATGLVRGEMISSLFTLESVDRGTRTRLVVEVQTDPKGAIPSWVVNLVQKSWAHTTITRLRRQLQKPGLPEDMELKALLDKAGFFE